ncbi:SDR family oxidoreductase [soil metagenome]
MNLLITGANRGIGLELARIARVRGHAVIGACRKPADAGELKATGARVVTLDVTSEASIKALGAELKDEALDALINNAGVSSDAKNLKDLTAAELARVFQVNAFAPLLVTAALLEALRRGQRKTIVHITSQLGSIANNTGGSSYPYRASKSALNQLNRSLAAELKGEFTCLAVHPGWVQTDMGGQQAPMTPAQSAEHIFKIIESARPEQSGAFLNYDGATLPW